VAVLVAQVDLLHQLDITHHYQLVVDLVVVEHIHQLIMLEQVDQEEILVVLVKVLKVLLVVAVVLVVLVRMLQVEMDQKLLVLVV
jgi:hypothetical protein